MRRTCFRILAAATGILTLAGCVTTQTQPDGSTKVRLALGLPGQRDASAPAQPTPGTTNSPASAGPDAGTTVVPGIRATSLAALFAKHPFDGATRSYYPRVAVNVVDWSRSDCWLATATIWWSKARSKSVPTFSVCWGQSVGYAVNNAANLHLFMLQTSAENSGNVRTNGPKPPLLAIPDRQPITERQQLAFQGFIQQLVLDTGWQPGAPTNLWLAGYGANSLPVSSKSPETPVGANTSLDARVRSQLERALSCSALDPQFTLAESALNQMGWRQSQGVTPVTLPGPVQVYGFEARKVAISRDGFEHIYRSFLEGVDLQRVVKAASLKIGKDGKTFGRVTRIGVLTAETQGAVTTLTCTVETESAEG